MFKHIVILLVVLGLVSGCSIFMRPEQSLVVKNAFSSEVANADNALTGKGVDITYTSLGPQKLENLKVVKRKLDAEGNLVSISEWTLGQQDNTEPINRFIDTMPALVGSAVEGAVQGAK